MRNLIGLARVLAWHGIARVSMTISPGVDMRRMLTLENIRCPADSTSQRHGFFGLIDRQRNPQGLQRRGIRTVGGDPAG